MQFIVVLFVCLSLRPFPDEKVVGNVDLNPSRIEPYLKVTRPKRPTSKRPPRRPTPQGRPRKTKRSGSVKRSRSAARSVRKASTTSKVLTLAILGNRYARVPILDRKLGVTVYYLASGHGGPDPGAIGRYGSRLLPEDEYAYDVTLRLARLLLQHSATVYMLVQDRNDGIRDAAVLPLDKDEVAYPNQPIPLNQTARLRQTTTAANRQFARHKGAYQRLVTIHVDSRSQSQTADVFFYHHPQSRAGLKLANHIHRRFLANYKRYQPDRPYHGRVSPRGTLYVVKNSHPPTVFIELGNIQNKQDQRRFVLAANRQAVANWLYQGIEADYQSR